ncbi:MAG: FAD-dependent oxidoreductase [Deltaproteobacteria bacterium RBG_13_52_11]|nr:MAG: FAD-dependent oxidoreductase [Deltaproteobacteria bacterium RBG_13_52_11]
MARKLKEFDVIVVGAGPAGASAALRMAQRGLDVLLLERGETPGAKNMFGGMMPFFPVAEELIPDFWMKAPWERHVVKRILYVSAKTSSTSMVFEADAFDCPPYNGFTLFRPVFDRWLAEETTKAGATLLCSCLVKDLIWKGKEVSGVKVGRDNGNVRAKVVVACDGVLSFLAQKAGLRKDFIPSQMALGVKALFRLTEEMINERFNLVRTQGATCEFLGCTDGIRGGGFIYTQTETLSVGIVLHLDALKKSGKAPYLLFEEFIGLPPVRRYLKDARLVEYSAHLLPEGGYRMVPKLFTDGMLVAGDAAALCYTNGLNQEGMNLAIASGFMAAETVIDAFTRGDFSSKQLSQYEARLKESFVLKDMKTFKEAVSWMHTERLFSEYPQLINRIMEEIYRSDGKPRRKIGKIGWDAVKGTISKRDLIADLLKGGKSLLW